MANVKLFGLVLIITTSILALAAISTQTNRIRIRSFSSDESVAQEPLGELNNNPSAIAQPFNQPPQYNPNLPLGNPQATYEPSTNDVQFVSISIVGPLCIAGFVGMLLWFTPTGNKQVKGTRRSQSRKRK